MRRVNARKEEDMLTKHGIEKKRLPRIQKSEMKTRQQLFKQSLRISQMISPDQEREKIRHVSKSKVCCGKFTLCNLIYLFIITFSWVHKINSYIVAIAVWGLGKEEDKGWTAQTRTETQETVGWYESQEWSCPERTRTVAGTQSTANIELKPVWGSHSWNFVIFNKNPGKIIWNLEKGYTSDLLLPVWELE